MEKNMINQALALKSARLKAGLEVSDLAKLIGVTPQFVWNIEKGLANLPAHCAFEIRAILQKEKAKKAYLDDCEQAWLKEYKRKTKGR